VHPPAENFRFQLGFAQWARLESELLGQPLENEKSPAPGVTVQRTNRGMLVWAGVDGGVYLFHAPQDNACRIWREGWARSQSVDP
jgi:hypothetical protein